MTDQKKSELLRLIDELDDWSEGPNTHIITSNAASELRRLHNENKSLRAAMELIADTGMDASQCRTTARVALKGVE